MISPRPLVIAVVLAVASSVVWAQEPQRLQAGSCTIEAACGTVRSLSSATGEAYASATKPRSLAGIVYTDHSTLVPVAEWAAGRLPAAGTYRDVAGTSGTELTTTFEAAGDGITVRQSCRSQADHVRGVQWGIDGIRGDMEIIVPARSGVVLRPDSPTRDATFEYPMGWECQFVIVQGDSGGFWVWSDDTDCRFKRLRARRVGDEWILTFETTNAAPWAPQTSAESVTWRVSAYSGDWRVPARRYREWAEGPFGLKRLAEQRPAWVKDIRLMVTMGIQPDLLPLLRETFDPKQTLLYIPAWREDGYDRNYPEYSTSVEGFSEFVQQAHALGFKVMPHVNYFGCDPLNALYEQFEQYQCRAPHNNALLWWQFPFPHMLKEGEEPRIKFAYINPAVKAWRDVLVERLAACAKQFDIDAFHLDQTLAIFNDDNGLHDGLNMGQGNILLHEELRRAIPDVALSGEGLDEITFRHEAFAQRHAWGINHVEATWTRGYLEMAHPICSYIFTPYTTINGYLGMTSPANDQLYAAWREAYQHWWVIPTFSRPSRQLLESPTGFAAQLIAEAQAFQQHELDPDWDGDWPADVIAPYRGKNGARAAYRRREGSAFEVAAGGRTTEVARTITGVTEVALPGSVPGWLAYDSERIFSLDPRAWYAYLPQPRDMDAAHVESLPEGMSLGAARFGEQLASLDVIDRSGRAFDFASELDEATTGYQIFGQDPVEGPGPLQAPSGAAISADQDLIRAHPPWQADFVDPDTGDANPGGPGVAYARYEFDLPEAQGAMFRSEVYVDRGAIGPDKSDGVTFSVEFTAGDQTVREERHQTSSEPVPLDANLTPLAGKRVSARLQVHPGPANAVSFDWARWRAPRVELQRSVRGKVTVVAPREYRRALAGSGAVELSRQGSRIELQAALPTTVYLLAQEPPELSLPADLVQLPAVVTFTAHTGGLLQAPPNAVFSPTESACGGVTKSGIFAHPPSRGVTHGEFLLRLPAQPVRLAGFVGIRDESQSEGVRFIVKVNGRELFRHDSLPSQWEPLDVDLSEYAGQEIVLALVTDAIKTHYYDWATWGEPEIVAR